MRRRRRGLNRVLAAQIDEWRHLAKRDPSFSYLLAPELMNGATELAQGGHADEALELLEELVILLEAWPPGRSDNMLITALGMIGAIHLDEGRSQEAEEPLRRAIYLAPVDPSAAQAPHHAVWRGSNLVHLARCRELAGARDEALILVQQGVDHLAPHAPYDAKALELLSGARVMQDRLEAG